MTRLIEINSDSTNEPHSLTIREWINGPSRPHHDYIPYGVPDLKGRTIQSAKLGLDQDGDPALWLTFTDSTTLTVCQETLLSGTALPSLTASLLLQGKDITER